MGSIVDRIRDPGMLPESDEDPTFDPNFGFAQPRKPRVMLVSEEEMSSAKMPLDVRDYCAHHLIDYQVCKRRNFPWVYKCAHENHVWQTCQYEDYKMRMKEFERERRLRERERRIAQAV